ncbi:hypothetical protein MBM_06367 [Drepanopeziza brunnea f. sp. 'multigermtubi' MB_m1]|uniref:Uncharacterized protein n=1 Tax=Marssonina brunnea f. sp. multigermtubi (strain MB_m1) TaxID=1072389 RepID=K1WQC1_MARBU|nr:uncharacterized protein MBM_06367 [Drepanopeziza brunnea f. sp. 'multigermtubi' MB_m1]EKD15151.1 hypothetical protein MBM_06367 [Drepanopeziza brunnea f. sp. 'multigermtubi' MB_m1]
MAENTENLLKISNIEVGAESLLFSSKSFEFIKSFSRILISFGLSLFYFDLQLELLPLLLSETLASEMPLKINTGLKIYTIPLPFAPLAPSLSFALVIVDFAILHAFIITRMLLLSALRALCFSNTNITDFIENKTEQSRLFFFGLLVGIRNKTIKYYKVDELDLDFYTAFDDFAAFAFKTDQSAKTIEVINRKKSFLANFTKDIRTLVKEHTELASVLKSVKKALVVMPFTRELRFTMRSIIELITSKTKSLTQLPDALFNLNFKFDSKTATKPLLNIPLKMLEIKSASKEEFRLLLSTTDYKDEEKEKVEDTRAKCKIIAFARTPKTQLKLLINTGISIRPSKT